MWNWQVLRADYGRWPESMPVIPRNNCIYTQCDGLFPSRSPPLVTPGAHSLSSFLILISLALHLLHDSSEVISSANRKVLSDSWFILVRQRNLIIIFSFFMFFETGVIGNWKGNWIFCVWQVSKPWSSELCRSTDGARWFKSTHLSSKGFTWTGFSLNRAWSKRAPTTHQYSRHL